MTTKLSATLMILATFALGGILGALVNGVIANRQSQTLKTRPVGPLFVDVIEHAVQPNEDQRDAIRSIIDKYSERVTNEMEGFGAKMFLIADSLQHELAPLLTPGQRERLKESLLRPPVRRVIRVFGREEIEMLKEKLRLNEKQTADVTAIYNGLQHELESLIDSARTEPSPHRDKFMEMRKGVEEKVRTVLSPEQRKKYNEILELLPRGPFPAGKVFLFHGEAGLQRPPWDSTFKERGRREEP